jgi:catechol 2,3-dioxygenase-like lactoylglutathione lyase family enzyme
MIEVIAVLRVADADRAGQWWTRLGFEHEWTHRFYDGAPAFMSVRRETARVFLSEHTGDARPDTLLYVWLDDLDRIAKEFGAEPQPAEWDENVQELELTDPDGNRLRIGQR